MRIDEPRRSPQVANGHAEGGEPLLDRPTIPGSLPKALRESELATSAWLRSSRESNHRPIASGARKTSAVVAELPHWVTRAGTPSISRNPEAS